MIRLVMIALAGIYMVSAASVPGHSELPADYVDTSNLFNRPFQKEDCEYGVEIRSVQKCDQNMQVYHWDTTKKQCEETNYGGCPPTRNNFKTLDECKNVAEPICK